MVGFSFVTPITGLKRPNTGKEDDNDEKNHFLFCKNMEYALLPLPVLNSMGLPSFLDLPKSVFASNSYIHFMRMKLDD
jgi:hypothetical protein